jgi:nucleoside-diphosphate-sugar epimerase
MSTDRTALIIGATGGFGGETAATLLSRGWRVRAIHRHADDARRRFAALGPIEWVSGDAMATDTVVAAARGVNLIVHGANPPGYRNWRRLALPMLESSIAAAQVSGARIVFPGNVYNFGPDAFPLVGESAAQHPTTRKGAIRVAMEQRLQEAARAGVRSLIVRAGDFFGPRGGGSSWFGQAFVKPGQPVRAVVYPGPHDVGHSFAYLPDVAETIARLLEREAELADVAVFHFGGHWFARGVGIAEAIVRVVGNPRPPIRKFPWWAIYAASPFITTFREMLEMRYLWRQPVRLDNSKLVALLGSEPHTPTDQAVAATLVGLGCLAATSARGSAPAGARATSSR